MKEKVTYSKIVYEALDQLDKVVNDVKDAITQLGDNFPDYENSNPEVKAVIDLLDAAATEGNAQIEIIRKAEEKEEKEVHGR